MVSRQIINNGIINHYGLANVRFYKMKKLKNKVYKNILTY